MPDRESQITLEIEGNQEDDGHVRLSNLMERLFALQKSLNAINKSLTDKTKTQLHYVVVDATHSSPIRFVVEPHANDKTDSVNAMAVETHHRFFEELGRFQRREPPSPDLSSEAVEALAELIQWDRTKFRSVRVRNSSSEINLDENLKRSAMAYLHDEEYSMGQLEGRLESVNFHGRQKSFFIYPSSGPIKIRCEFSPGMKEEVRAALDNRVRVSGKKHYRKNQIFPHKIIVTKIEIVSYEHIPHLVEFCGSLVDDRPTMETLEAVKNDW